MQHVLALSSFLLCGKNRQNAIDEIRQAVDVT